MPRPFFLRVDALEEPSPDGRCTLCVWEGPPFYVKPTIWRRWGPEAWGSRLLGIPLPGDEGVKYRPQGYKIPEVGPDSVFGKGAKSAEEMVDRLRQTRTGGCPFIRVKTA